MMTIKEFARAESKEVVRAFKAVRTPIILFLLVIGGIWKFTDQNKLWASLNIASMESVERRATATEGSVKELRVEFGEMKELVSLLIKSQKVDIVGDIVSDRDMTLEQKWGMFRGALTENPPTIGLDSLIAWKMNKIPNYFTP